MKKSPTIAVLILMMAGAIITQAQKPPQKPEKVNVYRKYDKKKQETVTQTDLMLVYGPDPGPYSLGFGLSMFAGYTFPGQTPTRPDNITLNFMSSENSYVFTFEHDLTIKADNGSFNFGRTEYMQIRGTSAVAHEKLWQIIPFDVFARIANSRNVHVKLGQKEFDLTSTHLKNFQALLGSIGR